jgi:hypothetical protein
MKIIVALLLPMSVWAQYAPSSTPSTLAAGEINSKPAWQISSGAPTALACTAGKDFAFDSVGLAFYDCTVTGNPGTWVKHQAALGFTPLNPANNLSDVALASTARTNLGLGTAATLNVGVGANNVVQLNGSSQLPAVSATNLTNFPTLNQNTSGNAGTATALAALPIQCGGSTVATGIAASGNANCTASPGTLTIASGSTAMGTSLINSGACASAVTVAAAGVLTTDVISATFNGDPTAVTGFVPSTGGMLTIIPYPTAGNVNFKVCNNTLAGITPGAVTLNWGVRR